MVDFQKEQEAPITIAIQGEETEMLYSYMEVHMNNKLVNINILYRKGQSRWHIF